MDISQYYTNLSNSTQEILTRSLVNDSDLARVHSFVEDVLVWHEILDQKVEPIVIIKYAASEIQVAAFSLSLGLYRQAFISLRLALELSLSSIVFSANELEFKEWQRGERDIYWSQIIGRGKNDGDSHYPGVFSQRYSKSFYPELEGQLSRYNNLASETYRKLSEFVHGNADTWSRDYNLEFKEKNFNDWMHLFRNTSNLISFALSLRFLKQLNPQEVKKLQNHLLDSLGHIPEIRGFVSNSQ